MHRDMTSHSKALVLNMRDPMPVPTKRIDGTLLPLGVKDEAQKPSPRGWLPESAVPHLPSLLPLPPPRGGYAFASTPAPAPPASPSAEWSRRAAALGVSPRDVAPRPSRYSNPPHPGAAKLASLAGLHGSFPNPELGGVAAYPPSSAVAARPRPPAATLPPSKAL